MAELFVDGDRIAFFDTTRPPINMRLSASKQKITPSQVCWNGAFEQPMIEGYCTGGQIPWLGVIVILGMISSSRPLLPAGDAPFLRKVATRSENPVPLPPTTGSIGCGVKEEKMLTQLFDPIGSAER